MKYKGVYLVLKYEFDSTEIEYVSLTYDDAVDHYLRVPTEHKYVCFIPLNKSYADIKHVYPE